MFSIGLKVCGLVGCCGGIVDVMKREVMFAGGRYGKACGGTGSLETFLSVASGVFLAAVRLDELLVEACNDRFEEPRFDSLVRDSLCECCQRKRFVLVDA